MTSSEIKSLLREKKIPMWRMGKQLGVSENTISRWLRDVSPEHECIILAALKELEAPNE